MEPTIVIHARLDSTRLPQKVMLPIAGVPMVGHVWRRAVSAVGVDRVVVASGDPLVLEFISSLGGRIYRSKMEHFSGSDRVAEAARELGLSMVVNVQGDEPLISPKLIASVANRLARGEPEVVTAASPLTGSPAESSLVKVVFDRHRRALFFSRLAIPLGGPYHKHIGIYGYPEYLLAQLASTEPSTLEKSEGLEQLRLMEAGVVYRVLAAGQSAPSVDTQEELLAVSKLFSTLS